MYELAATFLGEIFGSSGNPRRPGIAGGDLPRSDGGRGTHSSTEIREIIIGHSVLGRLVVVSFVQGSRSGVRIISILAHDPDFDRDVALKLYHPDGPPAGRAAGSDHALAPQELLHEGRLMARVRHPNVVVIHGAEERRGRVGIWMDYVRGMTLEQMV